MRGYSCLFRRVHQSDNLQGWSEGLRVGLKTRKNRANEMSGVKCGKTHEWA